MNNQPENLETPVRSRRPKLGIETWAALAGTVFMLVLMVVTSIYAGPLWRDEVNTANVAQMPSFQELLNNMPFESFPPLMPLLERGFFMLGLAGSDPSIRVLGLYVGIFFLLALWLTSRWLGCRAPILTVALLGSLPAFFFIIGANRAYGLASVLLVLSFGLIWRMVVLPTKMRIILAGLTCFFFVHCVYYDVVFLAAILAGGAVVTLRRRQWKTLLALVGIGAVCAPSLAIYLPIIRHGSAYVPMNQWPFFNFITLWGRFGNSLTFRGSGGFGYDGPGIWLWGGLFFGGLVYALVALLMRLRSKSGSNDAVVATNSTDSDRALFCAVSMLLGVLGYFTFLFRLQYPTQAWYYIVMLCLCALSLDGLFGANWPKLRPWGWMRIGFMLILLIWGARSTWQETHTRRSNVDLIAQVLEKSAAKEDLIVVITAWEGITFHRYYHGSSHWLTVPPIESHLVHRNDLVFIHMNQRDPMVPMAPVLQAITNTLSSGHTIWVVGSIVDSRPNPQPPIEFLNWYGVHENFWDAQISATLLSHALHGQVFDVLPDGPVSGFEKLPLVRFSGFKADVDESNGSK